MLSLKNNDTPIFSPGAGGVRARQTDSECNVDYSIVDYPDAIREIEILRDVLKHADALARSHPMRHVRTQHWAIAMTCNRRIFGLQIAFENTCSYPNGRARA